MPKLTLPLPEALVFASEPEIKTQIIQGRYHSTYTQDFAIIADHDVTLPPLTWQYLNTDTGLTETLTTPSYTLHVNNPIQKALLLRYLTLLLVGILIGALLCYAIRRLRQREQSPLSELAKQIRRAKTDKALYALLLPYANDDEIAEIRRRLEENIHLGAGHVIDRSKLMTYDHKRNP